MTCLQRIIFNAGIEEGKRVSRKKRITGPRRKNSGKKGTCSIM
jgi:hypothetical protein